MRPGTQSPRRALSAIQKKRAVENTNKPIRQYIPKKESFEHYTGKRIMSTQKKPNERPREKFYFSAPKRKFFKHVSQFCACRLTLHALTGN